MINLYVVNAHTAYNTATTLNVESELNKYHHNNIYQMFKQY